jgi:ketosteroid isomerase-like protein
MLLAIVLALAFFQARDPAARELEEVEQRLAATWQKGDCAAWGAMLAPDWSVIHITGDVMRKAQAVEMCKAPRDGTERMKIDDVVVRVFGDAAVVTGRTVASSGGGAKPETVTLRFTDVFIRRGGRWEVVASHATQVTR